MPATSRGKIYNSFQLGNLFHLFSHKGLWSGSGNYRDNCLSKASRLASDQSVPPEQKRGKRFSVVSTTPPNSQAVSAPWGNSMSAFHLRTPTLSHSSPYVSPLPLGFFSLNSQKNKQKKNKKKHTHMPINKQEKKHQLKVCEMKPQYHNIMLCSKKEVFDLAAGIYADSVVDWPFKLWAAA